MAVAVDRSLRLPQSAYFPGPQPKSGIAIHHTVGGSARSTFEAWRTDDARVATAYIIDQDGTIYEVFPPAAWAWQFGLKWAEPHRSSFERRFIGIELASEGALREVDGELYAFDVVSSRTRRLKDQAFDAGTSWRGSRWFARYDDAQFAALGYLVDDLCSRFRIPREYPSHPFEYYGERLKSFRGIIGHSMVRADKSDPAPTRRLWETLSDLANAVPGIVTEDGRQLSVDSLTQEDIEALDRLNNRRLNRLDVAAGSLVKNLIMELKVRSTYLELLTPVPEAHVIEYEVAEGDPETVTRVARALGFKSVTARRLEAWNA